MHEPVSVPRRKALLSLVLASGAGVWGMPAGAPSWPLWQSFKARFIASDGRVIDHGTPREHSTSEGQSYAMFFALVADDRAVFDLVWSWSVANLCDGDAAQRLPAWLWGRRDDGSWAVVDPNAASDADLWMAYALLEAGRHWRIRRYRFAGQKLLALIAAQEVIELPGFGAMLLPGPVGFATTEEGRTAPVRWRLNPSYLPLSVLTAFGREDSQGPWRALASNTVRMVQASARWGYVADWVLYQREGGFSLESKSGIGSYDAIRVYLWAGLAARSQLSQNLLRAAGGMAGAISPAGDPPLSANVADGTTLGVGHAGFSAALVPYLSALGEHSQADQQRRRAETMLAARGTGTRYYDHALSLFGLGWADRRYQFLPSGQLWLPRES